MRTSWASLDSHREFADESAGTLDCDHCNGDGMPQRPLNLISAAIFESCLALIRRRGDQAGADEALQAAGLGMHERPIVERQIDDDEA